MFQENAKTYNDYHWRLKSISNNLEDKVKENENILLNESHSTENNDDSNILTENKNDDNNLSNEVTINKNNNDLDIINAKENKFKIKKLFDNDDNYKTEKEEEILPDISSPIKIYSTKNRNFIENNTNIINKENTNININRKPLVQEPNILKPTKIQEIKQKIKNRKNKDNEINESAKNNEITYPYMLQQNFKKNEENNKNSNDNNTFKNKIFDYLTKAEDWKINPN